jgi:hypothetical protein
MDVGGEDLIKALPINETRLVAKTIMTKPMIALMAVFRAAVAASGFPCDNINLNPATNIITTATTPEIFSIPSNTAKPIGSALLTLCSWFEPFKTGEHLPVESSSAYRYLYQVGKPKKLPVNVHESPSAAMTEVVEITGTINATAMNIKDNNAFFKFIKTHLLESDNLAEHT